MYLRGIKKMTEKHNMLRKEIILKDTDRKCSYRRSH